MKTTEQYIAERRAISQARIEGLENSKMSAGDWNYVLVKAERDALEQMPRVLDMLEKQQNLINYFAEYFSHDAGLNFVFDRARVCKQDLEKMVNE